MAYNYLNETGLAYFWGKIKSALSGKQNTLTPGSGIGITNDTISVTGTYAGSATIGGTANKTASIPYGKVDSTSTATEFTATVDGITELRDGICVMLENGAVTSAAGFTLNINGLGAKHVYNNLTAATQDTTIFNINYTMLFVYDSNRVEGGGWLCYRGYDSNTNTIGYQLRTNSGNLEASDTGYRYRLWFTSADGKKWVPANTSTSTDATTARTMNTRPINPFGPIVYNSTNGTVSSGARPAVTTLWQQYTLTIGYSYVVSLTAWDPVYVQCTPQSDGSAVMNAIVKALPTSNDGKIYIYLGIAYSTTAMELRTEHPVFYHDGTGIRVWTGKAIPTKTSELTNDSGYITSYTETDPTVPSWAKASTKPSYNFSELGNKPTTISGYGITDAYTKTQVDGLVSGVLHYKGTKATTSALPTSGNTTGDVWHVTADGSEWAWDGSAWQELGTAVDLSNYPTKDDYTRKATTGISIADHTTGSIYGVSSSTTSVTGVQSSTTTASKVTLGTAISVPNVTSAGSGSASLTMAIDSTDTKCLNITFSHTHTPPTLGTAISIPNVTAATDVTVPIKNTSATTVPIKNSSATTVVTGKSHSITDSGHSHGLDG